MRAIVYQQLSGKAAGTILAGSWRYGTKGSTAPEQVMAPTETMRASGSPGPRQGVQIAVKTIAGVVPSLETNDRTRC
jgi:hypothetical protein